jgi:hypothetical protein
MDATTANAIATAGSNNAVDASQKLRGEDNYAVWNNSIRMVIVSKGLGPYINGTKTKPPISSLEHDTWEILNAQAYVIIGKSIMPECRHLIQLTQLASEAWNNIKKQYEGSGYHLIHTYLDELYSIRLEDFKDLPEFNSHFNELRSKLSNTKAKVDIYTYLVLYMKRVNGMFPSWAERVRGTLRSSYNDDTIKDTTLERIQQDLLDEARAQKLIDNEVTHTNVAFYGNKFQTNANRKFDQNNQSQN